MKHLKWSYLLDGLLCVIVGVVACFYIYLGVQTYSRQQKNAETRKQLDTMWVKVNEAENRVNNWGNGKEDGRTMLKFRDEAEAEVWKAWRLLEGSDDGGWLEVMGARKKLMDLNNKIVAWDRFY